MSPGCLSFISLLGLVAAAEPPRLDRSGDPLPPRAVARLGTTRLRHGGWITGIAYSPDGKLLASASYDNTIAVWELPSGQRLQSFGALGGEAYALLLARGRLAALGPRRLAPEETLLQVWDIKTGKRLWKDWAYPAFGAGFALSPDGKHIAVPGHDGIVRLWDAETGRQAAKYDKITPGTPYSVAFVPGDKLLALAADDKNFCLWDVRAGKRLHTFAAEVPKHKLLAMAIAPDGRSVAFEAPETMISVRDVATGRERYQFRGHTEFISTLSFRNDSRFLASGGQDGTIRIWDLGTGKERARLDAVYAGFPVLAWSPDGKALATGWPNGPHGVQFWDAGTGRPLDPFPGHASPVSSISVSPDGRLAATSSWGRGDRVVRLWEVNTGRLVREFTAHEGDVFSVAFSPDGKWLASCSLSDELVRLWDARTGKQQRVFRGHRARARLLTFSPDGTRLASSDASIDRSGAAGPQVLVWETATGKLVHELSGYSRMAEAIVFTPDGRTVMVAGDGVRFWDVATGRPRGKPLMPGRFIWSVAISPDGKVLATADNDAVVRLLEFETRREIQELSYLQGGYRVAFARNGHLLAIGARGAIRLFDWSEGKARPAVEGHRGQVVCSVFTPDSTRLLGAGNEETWATVWDVAREVARPVVPRPRAEPAALQRWWQELGKDDPAAGYRAVWELVARPGQSVPLLKESLRPAPAADARQVARLLKGLEDKRFAERDRARRELEKLGEAAEGDLREALAGSPSLEQRRRIEELLEKLEAVPKSAEQLRGLRAVFVLEQIGSREAREVLEKLANGGAGRVLTRDAQTALHRLARRPVVP